jgi:hypothetical protein
MLQRVDLDNALAAIVEAMLPRFSPADLGLVIQLDLRASKHSVDSDDDEKSEASLVTFIIQRPHNYTKVLAKRTDFRHDRWLRPGVEIEMDMTSDHDSCWRSDGFRILNDDWHDKVNKVGHPRDERVHFWNSFSMWEGIKYIKFKSFKVDRDERKVKFVIEKFLTPDKLWSTMENERYEKVIKENDTGR